MTVQPAEQQPPHARNACNCVRGLRSCRPCLQQSNQQVCSHTARVRHASFGRACPLLSSALGTTSRVVSRMGAAPAPPQRRSTAETLSPVRCLLLSMRAPGTAHQRVRRTPKPVLPTQRHAQAPGFQPVPLVVPQLQHGCRQGLGVELAQGYGRGAHVEVRQGSRHGEMVAKGRAHQRGLARFEADGCGTRAAMVDDGAAPARAPQQQARKCGG